MKKHILAFVMFCMGCLNLQAQDTVKDWANFGRYREANEAIENPVKAVFMGNSITDNWAKMHPEFFTENGYVGRGISGQVSAQMVMRFRRDVIDLHPKAVVILAGTNDIALNDYAMTLEETLNNVKTMVDLARANDIKVVICSTMPAYQFGWRKALRPAQDIKRLNRMMQLYALENHIPYVDYHSAMKDERDGLPLKYSPDGVHPNLEGYAVMEKIIQNTLKKIVK